MSLFEIQTQSSKNLARTGLFKLVRKNIKTPAFMPIGTQGSVKTLSGLELEKLGFDLILGNTYHLWSSPDLLTLTHFGGYHNFISWDKPVLTDSGGFQAFSLSKIRKFTENGVTFKLAKSGEKRLLTPEYSMLIQTILGSDIALVLDECLPAEVTENEAKRAMERTYRWAERSKKEFDKLKQWQYLEPILAEIFQTKNTSNLHQANLADEKSLLKKPSLKDAALVTSASPLVAEGLEGISSKAEELKNADFKPSVLDNFNKFAQTEAFNSRLLFGIPQGAQFENLRIQSAQMTMELDFPGYSIGGVANGGEPEETMYSQVLAQTQILEKTKPKHLLGVGTPKDIVQMVARGIDLFDCVYPTRLARHGSVFFRLDENSYETVHLNSSKYKTDQNPINSKSRFLELQVHSRGYLCHLLRVGESLGQRLATLNNLEFYADLMAEIRDRIDSDKFDSWWQDFKDVSKSGQSKA